MKLIYRTILVLVIFAGLASCDDETIGERYGDGPSLNAQFRVDINGETFIADQYGVLTTEDGVTEIIGKRNDGARVRMKITGAGEDSYVLSGSGSGNPFYFDGVNEEPYTMAGIDTIGMLTISKYDIVNGLSSGVFSFEAYRDNSQIIDTSNTDIPSPADDNPSDSTDTGPAPGIGLPDTLYFTNGEFTDIPLNVEGYEPPDDPGEILSNFHVELDGELYEAEETSGNYTAAHELTLEAQNDSAQFTLKIFDTNETNITVGGDNPEGTIAYMVSSEDGSSIYEATSGNITLSELDMNSNLATGTCTGTLTDIANPENTIAMTNGVFEDISFESEISGDSYMLANIAGNNFNAITVNTEDAGNGLVSVIGVDASNNQLELKLPTSINTGTYQISNTAAFSGIYYEFDAENETTTHYNSVHNSGSIKITEKQGTVLIGTFTLSVRNEAGEVYQITEGEFKADIAL